MQRMANAKPNEKSQPANAYQRGWGYENYEDRREGEEDHDR